MFIENKTMEIIFANLPVSLINLFLPKFFNTVSCCDLLIEFFRVMML